MRSSAETGRSGISDTASWRDLAVFWGKARPPAERPLPSRHPLIFHSLDVAAVGEVLIRRWPGLGRRLASALGLDNDLLAALLVRLLALHDLGKFAPNFQAKSPEHWNHAFGEITGVATRYDHASGGYALLGADPGYRVALPEWRGLSPLAAAVTGHHGTPPRLRQDVRVFGRIGRAAAKLFADLIGELLPVPPTTIESRRAARASFAVAGFAVLCDWIGSNENWFPYQEPARFDSLADYWAYARAQAERAIAKAGVLPARSAPRREFREMFQELASRAFEPSPMQRWAAEAPLPDGPFLAVLEDETGSGKTEAALVLAHRLLAGGRAEGLYVALPTMATANAMFGRLAKIYKRLFAVDADPSIALVHSRRDLVEGFRQATLPGGRAGDHYGDRDDDTTASAECAAWIADDRRRAFLADIGAGTADQAALAILPTKHQSLRLFGLSSRVLIVDEVHAYDEYVRQLVMGLLEFHAAQGGSAILLSATLPAAARAEFVRAFAKGAGADGMDDPELCYPRATLWSAMDPHSRIVPVEGKAERAREVPVRLLPDRDAAIEAVAEAARSGAAVLYLRNTVGDTHDAHRELAALGCDPRPILFHSQFALCDRLERESEVLALFGPESKAEDRRGRILVSSQVAEQSLDLDFDLIVTDLAPIDLIIQRAGRLWRHPRRERTGRPELLVVSPEPVDDPDAGWYKSLFPRAAFVYSHPGRLWLTARKLKEEGAIRSPRGLRDLVEAVYGEAAALPPKLDWASSKAEGQEKAAAGFGKQNVLKLFKGYNRDDGAWDTEERTPTRLVDQEQIILRLARIADGRVMPWAPVEDGDHHRAWRLSEVAIAKRRIVGEARPAHLAAAIEQARVSWTRYDADKILVVLEQHDDEEWTGSLSGESGRPIGLSYSRISGLSLTEAS